MFNKIRPSAIKPAPDIFRRNMVTTLLYPMGHTFYGKPWTAQFEKHDLDPITGFLQAAQGGFQSKGCPLLGQTIQPESSKRPAARVANSGCNGDNPDAIRSAFTNIRMPLSFVRNFRANVVFPAPFGPAMMMHLGCDFFERAITRSPASPCSPPAASPSPSPRVPHHQSRIPHRVPSACRAR